MDVRLQLMSILFPTGLKGDATIERLLETESNALLGLDSELSWHLHQLLARLARLGLHERQQAAAGGGNSAGKLAQRLCAMHPTGKLLTLHQSSLLTHQFAAQLEMSGAWQAAVYVLLASLPVQSRDASSAMATDTDSQPAAADSDAREEVALAVQALLLRYYPWCEHDREHNLLRNECRQCSRDVDMVSHEPVIEVPNVDYKLTVDMMAERLHLRRELVLTWFVQAQVYPRKWQEVRRLYPGAGKELDRELDLSMRSGDDQWLRANRLVLL